MPTRPISSTFTDFLHQSSPTPLQITFATLEITNHQNGQFLNRVQREQSRIVLQKMSQTGLAQMTVLDNLVFRFSFQFHIPNAGKFQNGEMLALPRPLDRGRLSVDNEKLVLSFRINAPDPSLRVEVTQVYKDICKLEVFSAPLCGQTQ